MSGLHALEANHIYCLASSKRGLGNVILPQQQVLCMASALESAIQAAAKNLGVLRVDGAHLADCMLEALGHMAPGLATLSMVGTTSVTDAGLASLARGCRALRHLEIGGLGPWTECGGLTLIKGLDSLTISRRNHTCTDAAVIEVSGLMGG